jgi:hypothetical protein
VGGEECEGPDYDRWREMLPVVAAVGYEREDLVREFVGLGASLDGEFGKKAVERAKKDGLESMLVLLGELGVNIEKHEE